METIVYRPVKGFSTNPGVSLTIDILAIFDKCARLRVSFMYAR